MLYFISNFIFFIILFILNVFFFFTPLDFSFSYIFLISFIIFNLAIYICTCLLKDEEECYIYECFLKILKTKTCIISISLILLIIAMKFLFTSKIFHYEKYRQLANDIETIEFKEDMNVVDLEQLPIHNIDTAMKLADKKLGEIPSLGSTVEIKYLTLQKINGELYFVGPLEHSGFFKWLGNKKGTQGYIKVSATKENDVELVTEINGKQLNLKYLESSYFNSDLERYSYSKEMKKGLTDYSFEIDDQGNPYWIISVYERTIGTSGIKVIGTLIINPQTGESERYSIEDTPKWVDRIQPMNITIDNLDNWGKLIHGVFNFSGKDKLQTTQGMNIIYNREDCYYYTGVSSTGSDESLNSFFLTNTRTGITKRYLIKSGGANENAARKSLETSIKQYDYKAAFPTLINIQNSPTYFMTLLDDNKLIKKYGFVNVEDFNIVGLGDTVGQAYSDYIKSLSRREDNTLINNSEQKELTGIIERFSIYNLNSSSYCTFTLEGQPYKFIISIDNSIESALTKIGDNITIKFIENDSENTNVNYFKNNSIK